MAIEWYHNSKTGEIENYTSEDAGYELKGVLYAYGDAVTTGFNSRKEAEEWAKEWGYCEKCDSSKCSHKDLPGHCFMCRTKLKFVKGDNSE